MLITIAVFIGALLIGVPICYVLGLAGFSHLIEIGNPQYFTVLAQRIFSGVNQMGLTCIPFFIIAGQIMNSNGVTNKLVDFVREFIGHIKGGLAYTVVILAMLLSAILGSANAVATILCGVLIPEMKKDGYPPEFTGALIASSGILGPIIPPSVDFVFYCVLTQTSVAAMFAGGVVPGILLGGAFAVIVFIMTRKMPLIQHTENFDAKRLFKAFVHAIPALIVPLIMAGGILTGVFTPTESGAIAVVAAIAAGIIYGNFDIKIMQKILVNTATVTAGIFVIIGFGNVLGWTMAISDIPTLITNSILAITTNKYIIIFIMVLFLFALGCVMEVTAAMIIFVPVFLPLALQIGLDPIHFGVIFSIIMTIGMATPPVGVVLFVVSNIADVPLGKLSRAIIPFMLAAFAIVLILAYCPGLVNTIPSLLGYM